MNSTFADGPRTTRGTTRNANACVLRNTKTYTPVIETSSDTTAVDASTSSSDTACNPSEGNDIVPINADSGSTSITHEEDAASKTRKRTRAAAESNVGDDGRRTRQKTGVSGSAKNRSKGKATDPSPPEDIPSRNARASGKTAALAPRQTNRKQRARAPSPSSDSTPIASGSGHGRRSQETTEAEPTPVRRSARGLGRRTGLSSLSLASGSPMGPRKLRNGKIASTDPPPARPRRRIQRPTTPEADPVDTTEASETKAGQKRRCDSVEDDDAPESDANETPKRSKSVHSSERDTDETPASRREGQIPPDELPVVDTVVTAAATAPIVHAPAAFAMPAPPAPASPPVQLPAAFAVPAPPAPTSLPNQLPAAFLTPMVPAPPPAVPDIVPFQIPIAPHFPHVPHHARPLRRSETTLLWGKIYRPSR